ncbi:hypothetical protein PVL29_023421 [Vitis rotundifolia]|uniref:Ribosomal eL28/Mak16 domain-containing protein n=1 Tax=Vitis rotundifolia TaxID=103349 RepID=A0AA38YNZ3_VITRO|nr:hypothetical protein PVL29_023421 [Vitis rotundifolia]
MPPKTLAGKGEMATVPGQLIWEIFKKNSFLVKEFGDNTASVQFSKESNNLYNVNSYKHSRLANRKTVTIPGGKDDVQKVQWEVLEAKIGNWIHFMRRKTPKERFCTCLSE